MAILIPVINAFNGAMKVTLPEAVKLLQRGRVRLVGEPGNETALEWLYDDQPSEPTRTVRHRCNYGPVNQHIEDAYPDMPVLATIGYDRRT